MSDTEWHHWRGKGIGGSDIAALLGLSNFASPWSVWAEKVGLLPPSSETQRQRLGKRMEAVLAAEFRDETGLTIAGEQTWCEHPEHPELRCTVDGFVFDGTTDVEEELALSAALGPWEAKTDGRFGWPDGVPPGIRAQCIWNMGVTRSRDLWLTVGFAGWRIEHFHIEWDSDAEADWQFMSDRARVFWDLYVLTGAPPPVDASQATHDAIAAVWPEHQEGVCVDLDPEEVAVYGELKEMEKLAKDELDEMKNRLAVRFGAAEVGLIAGLPALTYRSQTRTSRCENCGHEKTSDPFRVLRNAPKPKTNQRSKAA